MEGKVTKRNVEFAVIASDGVAPDASIHSVGYEEPDGINAYTKIAGSTQAIAALIAGMANNFVCSIKKKGGLVAAIPVYGVILEALKDSMSLDELKEGSRMSIARAMADAVMDGALDEGDVENILGMCKEALEEMEEEE